MLNPIGHERAEQNMFLCLACKYLTISHKAGAKNVIAIERDELQKFTGNIVFC